MVLLCLLTILTRGFLLGLHLVPSQEMYTQAIRVAKASCSGGCCDDLKYTIFRLNAVLRDSILKPPGACLWSCGQCH